MLLSQLSTETQMWCVDRTRSTVRSTLSLSSGQHPSVSSQTNGLPYTDWQSARLHASCSFMFLPVDSLPPYTGTLISPSRKQWKDERRRVCTWTSGFTKRDVFTASTRRVTSTCHLSLLQWCWKFVKRSERCLHVNRDHGVCEATLKVDCETLTALWVLASVDTNRDLTADLLNLCVPGRDDPDQSGRDFHRASGSTKARRGGRGGRRKTAHRLSLVSRH